MPVRDGGAEPLALGSTAAKARHVGGRPGLVDEDEPSRIEVELALEPGFPARQDVRTVLLRGVNTLFLNVRPRESKKRHSVVIPTATPRSSRSRACISASVMSSRAPGEPTRSPS